MKVKLYVEEYNELADKYNAITAGSIIITS